MLWHDRKPTCLPQEFLRKEGSLVALEQLYKIKAKRHPVYPHLVQLKYSQIDSPMGEPIVQQCRGIILNAEQDWAVVARPMDKFFNHGEGHAAPINWGRAVVQEKLDGSMLFLYYYEGDWHVATTGMPDAGGEVNGFGFTFAELFWKTFHDSNYVVPGNLHASTTFMFELTTPYNRMVVAYEECDLTLIGLRNNWSGFESPVQYHLAYDAVKSRKLHTIDEVIGTFDTMDPLIQEGYVIVDDKFNRIKVKHPGYVALHHMRSGFSAKTMVEVIRSGETAEILVHFPEWREPFEEIKAAYDGLVMHLEGAFKVLKDIPEGKEGQKVFAAEATKNPCSGVLFGLRKGYYPSVREGLKDITIDRMMTVLRAEDIKLVGQQS